MWRVQASLVTAAVGWTMLEERPMPSLEAMVVQNTRSKYPVNPCSLDLSVTADKHHREYPWFLPVALLAVLTNFRPAGDQRKYPVSSLTIFSPVKDKTVLESYQGVYALVQCWCV